MVNFIDFGYLTKTIPRTYSVHQNVTTCLLVSSMVLLLEIFYKQAVLCICLSVSSLLIVKYDSFVRNLGLMNFLANFYGEIENHENIGIQV